MSYLNETQKTDGLKKNLRWWVEKKYKDQFRLKKNYKVHFIDRHDGLKGELDIYKKAIV